MRQNTRSLQPPAILLMTPKFRDRLIGSSHEAMAALTEYLSSAPTVKNKYVMVDLRNKPVRDLLAQAVQPWAKASKGLPPALVGSAKRISTFIGAYEQKISNYDLFEDYSR